MSAAPRRAQTLIYLEAGRFDDAAGAASRAWQAGVFGQAELGRLLADAAAKSSHDAARWQKAAAALPSPLRELALAESHLRRGDGAAAAAAVSALPPPLRYPTLTWRLRAKAAQQTGEPARERQALIELLRLTPADKAAARRLARLELSAKQPFAGLLRLSRGGWPLQVERLAEPLSTAGAEESRLAGWFGRLPRAERADFAEAVVEALAALDRPAAAAACGRAALDALGDEAPRALRKQVEQLEAREAKLRQTQATRFWPTDNLVQ
jgi:hypothetical protein